MFLDQIKILEWDSRFFAKQVISAQINSQSKDRFNLQKDLSNEALQKEICDYLKINELKNSMVYLFSDEEILSQSMYLKDIKVTYEKYISNGNEQNVLIEKSEEIHEFADAENDSMTHHQSLSVSSNINSKNILQTEIKLALKQLCVDSSVYSRFRKDKQIDPQLSDKLYELWFDKALFNSNQYKILYHTDQAHKPCSLLILKKELQKYFIDIIAVRADQRGRSLGQKLIYKAEEIALASRIQHLSVITQAENQPACRLYEKCQFSLLNKKFIYHYHF